MEERLKFAVFIDFDNIEIGVKSTLHRTFDVECVLEGLKERGEIVSKVAYGNWSRQQSVTRAFTENGVQMVQRDSTPRGDKNGADINLALDALELAFTSDHINAFCILSGDSDFMALVNKLKQYNKRVYIVGGKAFTSTILQRNCHEFISYESLYESSPQNTPRSESARLQRPKRAVLPAEKALPVIDRALRSLDMRGSVPQMGLLKSTVLQLDPAFSERNYGSSSFKGFIDKLADKGFLTVNVLEGHFVVESKSDRQDSRVGPTRDDALAVLCGVMQDNTELLDIGIPGREVEALVLAAVPGFDPIEYGVQDFAELLNLAQDKGYVASEADAATGLRYFEGDQLSSARRAEAAEPAKEEAAPAAAPKRARRSRRKTATAKDPEAVAASPEDDPPKRRPRRKRANAGSRRKDTAPAPSEPSE